MVRRRHAVGWALGLWVGSALASGGAHYEGIARDGLRVRVYLHGGPVVAREGTVHTTGVAVRVARGDRPLPTIDGCVYRYDEADRRRGEVRCAARPASPLRGAAWARDAGAHPDDPEAPMVCVARCGRGVPARLVLDAHPDNH